jgi:hypothetical protein
MNTENVLKICIIFLFGFLSANLISYYIVNGFETPFSTGFGTNENTAPQDFIKENQIQIYDDKVVINVKGASLSRYAATGSMKPTFDENANGIRIVPKSEDEINVGDIITYQLENSLIVHRVVEKGTDKEGVYFITRGDNNTINDSKIRFSDIKYETIAMVW